MQRKLAAELNGDSDNVNHVADTLSQALFSDGGCNYVHSHSELRDALFDMTHQDILNEHKKLRDTGFVKVSVLSPSDSIINACKKFTSEMSGKKISHHVILKEPTRLQTSDMKLKNFVYCTMGTRHKKPKHSN